MDENEKKLQEIRDKDEGVVFDRKWFERHQSKLLWLLNSRITKRWFRWCMRVEREIIPLETRIEGIAPNYLQWGARIGYADRSALLKTASRNPEINRFERRVAKSLYRKIKKGVIEDKKILVPLQNRGHKTHDKYSKRMYYAFKPFWYLLHFFDWAMLDRVEYLTRFSFGFSTLQALPVAGANSPCDGVVQGTSTVYATARSTATTANASAAAPSIANYKTGANYTVGRHFFNFDTSEMGTGATPTAVDFVVKDASNALNQDAGQATVHVVASNPASSSNVTTSDFNSIGSTSFANLAFSNWGGGASRTFSLDSNGVANANPTGISQYGLRLSGDLNNSTPTAFNFVDVDHADTSGTSNDPTLNITYTPGTSAPTVTTQAADQITATTARGNGNVTADGGATITERGVCWSTSANPTTGDSKQTASGTTGAYTANMTGLSAGTLYHYRAYAINSVGTSYGADTTFTTDYITTKTETGVARIQKSVTQTETGVARITATTLKTETGVARIQATTTNTETGLARIEKSITQTEDGIARITATTIKTETGTAAIQNTTTQSETGKARIEKSATQTESGVSRIQKSDIQTELGVSRITQVTLQAETGKARITTSTIQTESGVANIQNITTRNEIGLARIEKSVSQTINGVSRLLLSADQTITGVANIQGTTIMTETGISAIQGTTNQNETGVGRIEKSVARTTTGTARVQKSVAHTVLGVARITASTQQTESGKSRIEKSMIKNITGKSALQNQSDRIITGLARIANINIAKTIAGVARIRKIVLKTITGKSRIQKVMTKNITGHARILAPRVYPYSKKNSPYTPFPH